MVGVGPFITIPLIIAAMGGPQCMLGWLLGAVLALCDGLVWSELAAAMPGTGGTYLYLREAFRKTSLGGILPFLFIWQFIFSGPLEIASGYIGFAQYVGYFWHGMGRAETRMVCLVRGCGCDRSALSWGHCGGAVDRRALGRHAGDGLLYHRQRPLQFSFQGGLRLSAERVHVFDRLCHRTRLRHADCDVRFHGLLQHLLCRR